jgi:hypothetical protein
VAVVLLLILRWTRLLLAVLGLGRAVLGLGRAVLGLAVLGLGVLGLGVLGLGGLGLGILGLGVLGLGVLKLGGLGLGVLGLGGLKLGGLGLGVLGLGVLGLGGLGLSSVLNRGLCRVLLLREAGTLIQRDSDEPWRLRGSGCSGYISTLQQIPYLAWHLKQSLHINVQFISQLSVTAIIPQKERRLHAHASNVGLVLRG